MKIKITQLQAFNAISMLFQTYYIETFSDDLGGILSSMSFLSDNSTADPAMWEVWVEFLENILNEKKIKDKDLIDPLYAFIAMKPFLEYFFETENLSIEVSFFIKNAEFALENKTIDPVLLKVWLNCIQDVLAIEDSRDYLTLV